MKEITIYIITAIAMIGVDICFLSLLKSFFDSQIRSVQGTGIQLDLYAVWICYLVLVTGLYYFIIKDNRPIIDAFFLGFVINTVYETTNKSLLSKWRWETVAVDGIWGGILFAITATLVYAIEGKKWHIR
jgi:uncharacterized membrane protein